MSDSRSEYYDSLREERAKFEQRPKEAINTSTKSRFELMVTAVCEAGYSIDLNLLEILKLIDSKLPEHDKD